MPYLSSQTDTTVFRAIADPTRRAILNLLRDEPLSVQRIAAEFRVSRPAISQHLKVLRDARLVRERKEGRRRFYGLRPEPLAAVDRWLAIYRESWRKNLLSLKDYAEAEERARPRGRHGGRS